MPQVTVYIREEDLEKWKSVEKKSEFISNALRRVVSSSPSPLPNRQDKPLSIQRACCKLPKPCQHWIYDGTSETWTNVLDGEVKGV